MKSAQLGRRTSDVEVQSIASQGLWLLVDDREHFLSFTQFPWFRRASVEAVLNVERAARGHLYWPELDIDLAIESIEHPQRFPLVSRVRPNNALQRTRAKRRLKSVKRSRGARR